MLYILFTTGKCNLRCKYCGGSFSQKKVPWKVNYKLKKLNQFISKDSDPIIAFYGGEPLLNHEFIIDVINNFPNAKYVIQTNGILIKKLEPKFWLKFETILLSIDGRENVTNLYRGKVYDKVINSAIWLKKIGFNNDLVARMTISEKSNIFLDVKHLLSLNIFDHIHWQLDVIWSCNWKNFDKWCNLSYFPGLRKLIKFWIEQAKKGKVMGIVPIIALLNILIKKINIDRPPCGAGLNSFAISTNGDILACPIAVDVNWAKLGNLKESKHNFLNKITIKEPCIFCNFVKFCGGRCLYAYHERLWGQDGFDCLCKVTIFTIKEIMKIQKTVQNLINLNIISIDQLKYPSFNNTIEIIP